MDDVRQELDSVKMRLRLQMIVSIGLFAIVVFAMGGADALARTLVEADAWKVRTKNLAGTLTDRIVVTTDVDSARIKVSGANLELAQQTAAPSAPAEGALWYDSTNHLLKYWNGTLWVIAGGSIGCRLYNNANYTIPTTPDEYALSFNSERYDPENMHSTSANLMKITFPTPGRYLITSTATFTGPAGTRVELGLMKNPTLSGNLVTAPWGTFLASTYMGISSDGYVGIAATAIVEVTVAKRLE